MNPSEPTRSAPAHVSGEITAAAELEEIDRLVPELTAIGATARSHRAMLVALLSAYKVFAEANPCCTRTAAEVAADVAAQLMLAAIQHQAAHAPGRPLH